MSVPEIRTIITGYLRNRAFLVALVSILFIMGIVFGVLAAAFLEVGQRQELLRYLDHGLHSNSYLSRSVYTRQTIMANVQTVFFLFFMGISVIGVPLALLLVFTRGFILGFSSGFLLQTMGLKGLAISLMGILPHNILLIPGLLLMVVALIDCAVALTKLRFTRKPVLLGEELMKCVCLTMLVLVIVVVAGLIQGYATPVLTVWITRIIS